MSDELDPEVRSNLIRIADSLVDSSGSGSKDLALWVDLFFRPRLSAGSPRASAALREASTRPWPSEQREQAYHLLRLSSLALLAGENQFEESPIEIGDVGEDWFGHCLATAANSLLEVARRGPDAHTKAQDAHLSLVGRQNAEEVAWLDRQDDKRLSAARLVLVYNLSFAVRSFALGISNGDEATLNAATLRVRNSARTARLVDDAMFDAWSMVALTMEKMPIEWPGSRSGPGPQA